MTFKTDNLCRYDHYGNGTNGCGFIILCTICREYNDGGAIKTIIKVHHTTVSSIKFHSDGTFINVKTISMNSADSPSAPLWNSCANSSSRQTRVFFCIF